MKSVVVIFFLALRIQSAMSGNDIGENGCIIPAICKTPGYVETAWMPISRPVCEVSFGMERTKGKAGLKGENGPVGPKGEDGQQGKVGQAGPKGENGTNGKNGSKSEVGAKGGKGIKRQFGPKGGDSLVIKNIIKVVCPLNRENKCFFPVIGRMVDYDGGVAICEGLGVRLANIYSQTHMDDVMKYIRENRMGGSIYMELRLGMKYDLKAKNLTFRDGTDAPVDLKWHENHPITVSTDRTNVVLTVQRRQSATAQYLHNETPSRTAYVICEIA